MVVVRKEASPGSLHLFIYPFRELIKDSHRVEDTAAKAPSHHQSRHSSSTRHPLAQTRMVR